MIFCCFRRRSFQNVLLGLNLIVCSNAHKLPFIQAYGLSSIPKVHLYKPMACLPSQRYSHLYKPMACLPSQRYIYTSLWLVFHPKGTPIYTSLWLVFHPKGTFIQAYGLSSIPKVLPFIQAYGLSSIPKVHLYKPMACLPSQRYSHLYKPMACLPSQRYIYTSLWLVFHPKGTFIQAYGLSSIPKVHLYKPMACLPSQRYITARKRIAQYRIKFQIIHCQFVFWILNRVYLIKRGGFYERGIKRRPIFNKML